MQRQWNISPLLQTQHTYNALTLSPLCSPDSFNGLPDTHTRDMQNACIQVPIWSFAIGSHLAIPQPPGCLLHSGLFSRPHITIKSILLIHPSLLHTLSLFNDLQQLLGTGNLKISLGLHTAGFHLFRWLLIALLPPKHHLLPLTLSYNMLQICLRQTKGCQEGELSFNCF